MAPEYLTVEHISTVELARVFSKFSVNQGVNFRGVPCWLWTGDTNHSGYGEIIWEGKKHTKVHRIMFAWLVHPIPFGRNHGEIDHLCRRHACCNPVHLDFVTHKTNVLRGLSPYAANARKTHCPNGHPYSEENLYIGKTGGRVCRTCGRLRANAKYRTNSTALRARAATWRDNNRERYRARARASYWRIKLRNDVPGSSENS